MTHPTAPREPSEVETRQSLSAKWLARASELERKSGYMSRMDRQREMRGEARTLRQCAAALVLLRESTPSQPPPSEQAEQSAPPAAAGGETWNEQTGTTLPPSVNANPFKCVGCSRVPDRFGWLRHKHACIGDMGHLEYFEAADERRRPAAEPVEEPCTACDGTGIIESDSSLNVRRRRCRECNGTGKATPKGKWSSPPAEPPILLTEAELATAEAKKDCFCCHGTGKVHGLGGYAVWTEPCHQCFPRLTAPAALQRRVSELDQRRHDLEMALHRVEGEREQLRQTTAAAWSRLTGWDAVRIANGSHVASADPAAALLEACETAVREREALAEQAIRLRKTAQTLIAAIGADGPQNADEAAERIVAQLAAAQQQHLAAVADWSEALNRAEAAEQQNAVLRELLRRADPYIVAHIVSGKGAMDDRQAEDLDCRELIDDINEAEALRVEMRAALSEPTQPLPPPSGKETSDA